MFLCTFVPAIIIEKYIATTCHTSVSYCHVFPSLCLLQSYDNLFQCIYKLLWQEKQLFSLVLCLCSNKNLAIMSEHVLLQVANIFIKYMLKTVFSFIYTKFLYPFGVSQVVCGSHFRLLAPWATLLLSQWMLHWWQVNGSIGLTWPGIKHSLTSFGGKFSTN